MAWELVTGGVIAEEQEVVALAIKTVASPAGGKARYDCSVQEINCKRAIKERRDCPLKRYYDFISDTCRIPEMRCFVYLRRRN